MPDAYDIVDARFIQTTAVWSAANALLVESGAVPLGKVWTILAAHGTPDVAETQDYWFMVKTRSASYISVTMPEEHSPNPAVNKRVAFVREGMEFKLFPGEALVFNRDAATAGSAIAIYYRWIETDEPLYEYVEPQEKKRLAQMRTSIMKTVGGGGSGSRPVGVYRGGMGPRTRLPGR